MLNFCGFRGGPARLGASAALAIFLSGCAPSILVEKIEHDQQYFEGLSYFLPKGVVDLTVKRGSDNALSLVIGAVRYIPDHEYHYSVTIDHNAFYDDEITVTVDDNGLLKAVNSITTDRTPDIIKKLAQAPLDVMGGPPGAVPEPGISKFDISVTLDPTSQKEKDLLNARLRRLSPQIRFEARPLVAISSDQSTEHPNCGIHICFRTAIPYVVELHNLAEKNTDSRVIARQVVVLPNRHVVGQIPVRRAPFVKKQLKLDFTSGMLTSVQLVNPSEVLEFIQIPIAVAKSVVAIPSAMLQFKTTQITADNNLMAAQQKNLELQTQIIQAQQSLLSAQTKPAIN